MNPDFLKLLMGWNEGYRPKEVGGINASNQMPLFAQMLQSPMFSNYLQNGNEYLAGPTTISSGRDAPINPWAINRMQFSQGPTSVPGLFQGAQGWQQQLGSVPQGAWQGLMKNAGGLADWLKPTPQTTPATMQQSSGVLGKR